MHAFFRSGLLATAVFVSACGTTSPGADATPEDSGFIPPSDAPISETPTYDASATSDVSALDAGIPTCTANAECPDTSYCAGAQCGGPGHCTTVPPMCTTSVSAVCGCDGHTYNNACVAAMEGVRVGSMGGCTSAPDAGPTPCTLNTDCATTELCDGASCGGPGTCVTRPTGCSTTYIPVCGCDGHTYSNACAAQSAGTRMDAPGSCDEVDASGTYDGAQDAALPWTDATPGPCMANGDCGLNNYCAGSACGTLGLCSLRPLTCPPGVDPVCGCDGNTYTNACLAATAGVRVAASSACVVPDGGHMACTATSCGMGSMCCTIAGAMDYGACYPTTCATCCVTP